MEYFWVQYEDLPPGLGYGRFSLTHMVTLAALAVLIICGALLFRRLSATQREHVLKVIPFVMLALECAKDLFLLRAGHFSVGYLPLHLCSLGMFVFFLIAFSRTQRWRTIFCEIAVVLILPGSIAALLFPDWAGLYPPLNFMNLYGYLWHGLLVFYPILCLIQRLAHPGIRHVHYVLVFLACIVPPVYLFDRVFRCNYMFVNWPPKGTPLSWIATLTGDNLYLLGYAIFALVTILLIYAIIEIIRRIHIW